MNASGADNRSSRSDDSDYVPRRVRIQVTTRRYWELRALLKSTGRGDDVGEVVGYLAASLYDGIKRPGSWEADAMANLFEEWPFEPPERDTSLTAAPLKTVEFDIAELVVKQLEQFALIAGAGNVTALLEHVVMVVCNGMDGRADWTLRLFGEWPRPKEIWCPQCRSDVFDERDLIVFPEGNLCPKCVADHTCSNCGKRLTKDEADPRCIDGRFVYEFDGALCNPCRAARDAAEDEN